MKKYSLIHNKIAIASLCTLLLCSSIFAMDKPQPESTLKITGTDSDKILEVPQSTAKMINTFKNLLGDVDLDINKSLPSDLSPIPVNFPKDVIEKCLSILEYHKISDNFRSKKDLAESTKNAQFIADQKNNIQPPKNQPNFPEFSLKMLIDCINCFEYLDLNENYTDPYGATINCKRIMDEPIENLKKRLFALSLKEIEENKETIKSLLPVPLSISKGLLDTYKIELFKQEDSLEFITINYDFTSICPITFSNNSKKFTVYVGNGKTLIFSTKSDKLIKSLDNAGSAKFTSNDEFIITENISNKKIDIWDANRYEKIQSLDTDFDWSYSSTILSRDDKFIASLSKKQITTWKRNEDNVTYAKLDTFNADGGFKYVKDFSLDGAYIIVQEESSRAIEFETLELWNLNTKTRDKSMNFVESPILLRFSLDGSKIIVLLSHELIMLNAKTFKTESSYQNSALFKALSSDDKILLAANNYPEDFSQKQKLFLIDIETNNIIYDINIEQYGIDSIQITSSSFLSPDGNTVALWIKNDNDNKKQSLVIINLLPPKKQDELNDFEKMPLFDQLEHLATKKENLFKKRQDLAMTKGQEHFAKAKFDLNITLRSIATEKFTDIKNKLASWWRYLTEQAE